MKQEKVGLTDEDAIVEVAEPIFNEVAGVGFPEEHKQPLVGLTYLGYLESSVEVLGHSMRIKTLKEGELIETSRAVAQYEGMVGYQTAYKASVVASCLIEVDGQPLYSPLSDSEDSLKKKVEVVLEWYPIVVDRVYEAYRGLERVAHEMGDELGKASGESEKPTTG